MSTVNVWLLHRSHRMSYFKEAGNYLNSCAVSVLTHPVTCPTIVVDITLIITFYHFIDISLLGYGKNIVHEIV